jgi:uncharacterized protein
MRSFLHEWLVEPAELPYTEKVTTRGGPDVDWPSLDIIMFLIAAGFVAAFVDAVVGGGGLVTLPALLAVGLPPSLALGTNKFASTMSSLTSMTTFLMHGKIQLRLVAALFPLSLGGAALGAYIIHRLPSDFLRPLVVVLLVAVTIYTLLKKNWGAASVYQGLSTRSAVLLGCGALAIGFYDGFFGPGTGSFLIFMFIFFGFDFVRASANAKVLNFASNLAALIMFWSLGSVSFTYGLPMGLAMILGAYTGSRMAVKHGVKFVKPLFVIMTVGLIGKQIWDVLMK